MVTVVYIVVLAFVLVLTSVVLVLHLNARQRFSQQTEDLGRRVRQLHEANEAAEKKADTADSLCQWYRHALTACQDVVLIYPVTPGEVPGRFVEANDAACAALEYTRAELLALSPMDVETFRRPELPDNIADVERRSLSNIATLARDSDFARRNMSMVIHAALRDGLTQYEGGYVTRTGRLIPSSVTIIRADIDGEPRMVAYAHNILEQKRFEAVAHYSERLLRDMLSNAMVGVAVYDGQRQLSKVNKACLMLFGCPQENEFLQFDLLDNPFLSEETKAHIARGDSLECEVSIDFVKVTRQGLFVTSKSDTRVFNLRITNLGVERDFSPRGHLVQVADITDRREVESTMDEMQRQLRHAQKMEAIGTLAGGIAHDFNNMLTPILGYAELGMDTTDAGSEIHDFMHEILLSGRRAKHLVEQILIFSRRGERAIQPISVSTIAKEVVKQLDASLDENITVRCAVKTDNARVLATPTQIHQMLMNLTSNGAYAMKDQGGILEVSISSFVLGYRHKGELPQLATLQYLRGSRRKRFLRISVRDTGPGMSEVMLERVFEPFFTTKPTGEGTGMGLPLVKSIATSLGGAVAVRSVPDEGTTFDVVVPLAEVEEQEEIIAPMPAVTGAGCILFVDDEPAILRMAAHMLSSLGYKAVCASESRRALEMFTTEPDRFDLVITDHVMPDMTGGELARQLLEVRPDLPIIMCTGFSEKFSPEKAKAVGIREFVMKPVERRDLAAAIDRAVSEKRDVFPSEMADYPAVVTAAEEEG